jgi:hypothetical protein
MGSWDSIRVRPDSTDQVFVPLAASFSSIMIFLALFRCSPTLPCHCLARSFIANECPTTKRAIGVLLFQKHYKLSQIYAPYGFILDCRTYDLLPDLPRCWIPQ